jgi:maleylpyruvate isomerase
VLKLYTYFRSSAAFRVRIALNHKGLAYQPEVIWLLDDEQNGDDYRKVNPQALVPTLVDGLHRLNQSMAIIEYLDETQPGPKLLPADPLGRARVRSLSQLIACEIHPLNNLRVLKHLKRALAQPQPAIDAWYRHWCEQGLAAFERQLDDGQAGHYCHRDTVSMADACLVPQIFNAQRYNVDLAKLPLTMDVFERLMKLPAFDLAQPSKQPDAARAAS